MRESTNRANIRYRIQYYKGASGLRKRVAKLIRSILKRIGYSDEGTVLPGEEKSRMIIYCPTLDIMGELADELDCPIYTGDHSTMSIQDKEVALA